MSRSRFRLYDPGRSAEFVRRGYLPSWFFPHRVYYLPKCGPDGFKLAARMCGPCEPSQLWELLLYAEPPTLDEFPEELYMDDDIVWHQQQFGRPGQVAAADLVVVGGTLYSMVHQSDLVQRIGRRREFKTRIENRFKGWVRMLLNALLNFAAELGLESVRIPTADFALFHTDRSRNPGRALFDRVYDWTVHGLFAAERAGDWWELKVDENRARLVAPEVGSEEIAGEKTVCVCHDVERGLGHLDSDPDFASLAEESSRDDLGRMLAVEEQLGVRATYSVVGALLAEERERIEEGGHAIAFHSYDHRTEGEGNDSQLKACRRVDYRIKGYRLPQSRFTTETTVENLLFHNFEWLASSARSLGFSAPKLEDRLVRIPIAFDDVALYRGTADYDAWERAALERIEASEFVAFGLHDCYGRFWLDRYERFLGRVRDLGRLRTLDEVASEVILASAV